MTSFHCYFSRGPYYLRTACWTSRLMITLDRLQTVLAGFPRLSIGLLGDLFLDRYLELDEHMHELSIETGLEAYQITRIRNSPGALGTIMNNLAAIGVGRMTPVTVVGDDGQAYDLSRVLGAMPVDQSHIIRDPARLTPTYTKPLRRAPKGGWAELNRLDLRNCAPLSGETQQKLLAELTAVFDATDGLIVLDQVNEEGWGVVGPAVRDHLATLAARSPEKLIFIDSRAHIARFRCGTLKPNVHECLAALGAKAKQGLPDAVPTIEASTEAAARFAQQTGCPLYCTMSERGMLVVEPGGSGETGGKATVAAGYPVHGPIDPVGAGDSATAGIVSALLAGATRVEAAAVGNLTASITVQQLGTTGTATPEQLIARWKETHKA